MLYKKVDMISLVIADFDFEAPGPIVSALEQRIDQAVYGYSVIPGELNAAVKSYY